MLRYSLATLVSVSLGLTGFAQTKTQEVPGLLSNNPGKIISNTIPMPKSGYGMGVVPASAKVTKPYEPTLIPAYSSIGTQAPVGFQPVQGIVGHTTTCAEPTPCATCPTPPKPVKSRASCFECFNRWFAYSPSPTPCDCGMTPTPYRPPLIAYFSCKGTPFQVASPTCATGCETGGCASGSHAAPVVVPQAHPGTLAPQQMPMPGHGTPMNAPLSSNTKAGTIQTTGYATSPLGTGIKPLSLYSPGGVKTTSMQKAEASPAISPTAPIVQPSPIIPGFRRLGGPKTETPNSMSLYPTK